MTEAFSCTFSDGSKGSCVLECMECDNWNDIWPWNQTSKLKKKLARRPKNEEIFTEIYVTFYVTFYLLVLVGQIITFLSEAKFIIISFQCQNKY